MKCSNCGHENPASQKFCGNCGAPLALAAAPSAEQPVGNAKPLAGVTDAPAFSSRQGEELRPAAAERDSASSAPRRPGDVKPSAGERKVLTVLFADVIGSVAMGEKLD